MVDLSRTPAFAYWLLALVILFFKMVANSMVQGYQRVKHRAFTLPDNARVFGGGAAPVPEELPIVQRASACWRNDLENIPIFLFLSLAYVLAGGPASYAKIYFSVFVLARIAHTLAYLNPTQPARFLAFNIGLLVCFVIAVHTLLLAW